MSSQPSTLPSVEGWPTLIRRARSSSGLSQAALGERIGVAASVISRYETGEREPGVGVFLSIMATTGHTDLSSLGVTPDGLEPTDEERADLLRGKVLRHLRKQGFRVSRSGILAPVETEKGRQRQLHEEAVQAQRERARGSLAGKEARLLGRLASGADVDPASIRPRLVLIDDRRSEDGLLWRWCSLHWSIPVSSGYGRRLRFLVVDEGHGDKVMGLVGLADPVFALGCRDAHIGWSRQARSQRLACVMDAFVLGAVPPYSGLLGAKLAALLTGSLEVREAFESRYGHRKTLISERDPNAHLALVTTSSALGRSSVYNRLYRPHDTEAVRAHNQFTAPVAFEPVGFTKGTGDFHFSGAIYDDLAQFARLVTPEGATSHRHERWTGDGFRNRREVIQRALEALGLDSRALRTHGVKRQVFLHALASNSYAWLRGEAAELDWYEQSADELGDWWLTRWALPRAERDDSWRTFEPEAWRLFSS